MSFERPYEGLKVLDLSQGVAGPYCAMLLARQGADVIKVEPLEGDWSRKLVPAYGDNTAFSITANLGKRGIAVDLKTDAGRAVIERLVPDADIFIEGFRPGVIERLGFTYDRLAMINPGLIYVAVSGFGQTGPLSKKPAMDPVLQAFTGFLSENAGPDGVPHRSPVIINDMATALYAQQAVAAALFARRDEPRGRRIEISLMEASANLQSVRLMSGVRDGPYQPSMVPNGTFPTKDGWLQVLVLKDKDFQNLCDAMDRPGLSDDDRFATAPDRLANGDALIEILNRLFAAHDTAYWRRRLTDLGIQNEAVQSYSEFAAHEHVLETGLISWLVQPGAEEPWAIPNIPGLPRLNPGNADSVAPSIGQHTRVVLAELDYTNAEIEEMAANSVIRL